jgi:hypothetical protein
MAVAALYRRSGRSGSPDGPGCDRRGLRGSECRPLPRAAGIGGLHNGWLQDRRRARSAGSPAPAAGQPPAPAAADAATFFSQVAVCVSPGPSQARQRRVTLRSLSFRRGDRRVPKPGEGLPQRYAIFHDALRRQNGATDRGSLIPLFGNIRFVPFDRALGGAVCCWANFCPSEPGPTTTGTRLRPNVGAAALILK